MTAVPGLAGSNSRALAAKYSSMVPWWSRWSRLRLVKAATSKTMPSTRCWARPWDETSMATARRSAVAELGQQAPGAPGPPGVVRSPSRVPMTPVGQPARPRIDGHQVGHRGLAVGPGDPDHGHARAGMAVEGRRHRGHGRPAPSPEPPTPGSPRGRAVARTEEGGAPAPPPRRRGRGRRSGTPGTQQNSDAWPHPSAVELDTPDLGDRQVAAHTDDVDVVGSASVISTGG